jgi:hypothetical protein
MIGLWRSAPVYAPGANELPVSCLFPSARQALSAGLHALGLSRADYITLPDWSSQCLIAAAGLVATPVPFRTLMLSSIQPAAILLYEQWGWPIPATQIDALQDRFPDSRLIFDRVDSATDDFTSVRHAALSLYSLFKVLGLPGGGLAWRDGGKTPVPFEPNPADRSLAESLLQHDDRRRAGELLKTSVRWLPTDIVAYTNETNISAAYMQERRSRSRNLHLVATSASARDWPDWMNEGLAGSPGIAPLLRGRDKQDLIAALTRLHERHHVEATLYHFDFAGAPLAPQYELCLAFPVHGEMPVARLEDCLDDIQHI